MWILSIVMHGLVISAQPYDTAVACERARVHAAEISTASVREIFCHKSPFVRLGWR